MLKKLLSLLLSFLVFVPSLPANQQFEDAKAPTFKYTKDQLDVIHKFGLPFQFTIVFLQASKFRYETWYYGGKIKKKFGFVNGKKELEARFGAKLADTSKVAFQPKQFTFKTQPKHLKKLFGTPEKIFKGKDPKIQRETDTYPHKGLAANFVKKKIDSVGTIPPLKKSFSLAQQPMLLDDAAFAMAMINTGESASTPPRISSATAAFAFWIVGALIVAALESLGDEDQDVTSALEALDAARSVLDALRTKTEDELLAVLTPIVIGLDIAIGSSGFCGGPALIDGLNVCKNPSLEYVNKMKDIRATMEKTTNSAELFPITVFNDTNTTGKECGEPPIPLSVEIDGIAKGSAPPGGALSFSLPPGIHSSRICGAGDFGCLGGPFKVPDVTVGHFFWICNSAAGMPQGAIRMP